MSRLVRLVNFQIGIFERGRPIFHDWYARCEWYIFIKVNFEIGKFCDWQILDFCNYSVIDRPYSY